MKPCKAAHNLTENTMPKYKVTLTRRTYESAEVCVEANDAADAEVVAIDNDTLGKVEWRYNPQGDSYRHVAEVEEVPF